MNPDRTRLRFQVPANAEPGECIHLSLVQCGWNGRIDDGMDIEIRVRKRRAVKADGATKARKPRQTKKPTLRPRVKQRSGEGV